MKHAYLIMAHNEFEVLRCLVQTLDDHRNDIFIHFDKKIKHLPELKTDYANLYPTEIRVDVRWGDVSMIEAEYVLFEAAVKKGIYAYYHLLSGVDMPIRSQDDIHDFFGKHRGKEFIGFSQGDLTIHVDRKVNRYHLFPRHFRQSKSFLNFIRRSIRYLFLRLQLFLNFRRRQIKNFRKGTNWVSVTHAFISYLLPQKNNVLRMYSHTFCADEIFLQTICWNSSFRKNVFDVNHEGNGCQRMIRWKDNKPLEWGEDDFRMLMASDKLFARKFSSNNIALVHRIIKKISKSN